MNKTSGCTWHCVSTRNIDISKSGDVSLSALLHSSIDCQMFRKILLKCFVNDTVLYKHQFLFLMINDK